MDNNEFGTMSFCDVPVFDFDSVDGIDGHFQYNFVRFHLESLKAYNDYSVEVYEDWRMIIWGDEGKVVKEFFIMENDEFRTNLYNKYPLTGEK
jgi:hypothetical protein